MTYTNFLRRNGVLALLLCLGMIFILPGLLDAQEPAGDQAFDIATSFTYQGHLTDGGNAATGVYDFRFALFSAATGGTQVGSFVDKNDVGVTDGLFTVLLGFGNVFNGADRWLEISVRPGAATGGYTTLAPRQALSPTPYAVTSASTLGLQGRGVSSTAPTSGQVLAWNGSQWKPSNNFDLPQNCATNQIIKWNGSVWACATDQSAALETRIAALETLLVHFSRAGNELTISGANLHVVNGLNNTNTSNGLGNVVIGYNETREFGSDNRSGSHVLAVGRENNYIGYGGIVVGERNTISGTFVSVSGGLDNIASGEYSSISGGGQNKASGGLSSVSGGYQNVASGPQSSASGGARNTASGGYASVTGGQENTASGIYYASISGGAGNIASAESASISGGYLNIASDLYASVSSGGRNTASGEYSSISGGYQNMASGFGASVSGGHLNTASYYYASVSGGDGNTASNTAASISGGYLNLASGRYAFIGSGDNNTASGEYSFVGGGLTNEASGPRSVVSGGSGNVASGSKSVVSGGSARSAASTFDWRAGTLFQDQ